MKKIVHKQVCLQRVNKIKNVNRLKAQNRQNSDNFSPLFKSLRQTRRNGNFIFRPMKKKKVDFMLFFEAIITENCILKFFLEHCVYQPAQ